jgi:hypothetical protein
MGESSMIALMQNLSLTLALSDAQSGKPYPVYRDGIMERTDEGRLSIISPTGGELSHQCRKFTSQLLSRSRNHNYDVAIFGDAFELGCKAWDNLIPNLCLNFFWELAKAANSLTTLQLSLPKVCFSR